ncbi:MAG: SDR family oxidoreductase [Actinomycetota bacterium]|nr:MAG: SDR family oxidoreductase [Actinomycetota bacterium]
MSTALVTGATSGLGYQFAVQLAARGHDLVLVARDADRLDEVASVLSTEHGVACEVLAVDLADEEELAAVEERLADERRPITVLVNNAGFSLGRSFVTTNVDDEQRLLDVLVTAVLRLTHTALPGMLARGRGVVLNVSSVGAWVPGSTYAAAKAWVTSFSTGLAMRLDGTGVRVVAVCPGFVHTAFHDRADIDTSGLPEWVWLSAEEVVSTALRDAGRGRAVSVAGAPYRLASLVVPRLPYAVLRVVSRRWPGRRG